jgi:hypothetical protein
MEEEKKKEDLRWDSLSNSDAVFDRFVKEQLQKLTPCCDNMLSKFLQFSRSILSPTAPS